MIPRVLTIAGSDSSGASGIQADLRTFYALGVYGATAITGVTAQSSAKVYRIFSVPPELVWQEIEAVAVDLAVDAVKTGMLVDGEIVRKVAEAVQHFHLPNLVVDPVMVSTGGQPLLNDAGVQRLRDELLPLATVVTPNLPEAERLVGFAVREVTDMERAARALVKMGCRCALVKGGHLPGSREVADVFFDGENMHVLRGPRITAEEVRGTGCVLSAAIAAELARGEPPWEAVRRARNFLVRSLSQAVKMGQGPRILARLFSDRRQNTTGPSGKL